MWSGSLRGPAGASAVAMRRSIWPPCYTTRGGVDQVLGIDIGGTKLAGGIVDEHGDVVLQEVVATAPESESSVMEGVAALAKLLLERSPNGVRGIGFGIPGTIDRANGTVVQAANLPLFNVPFVERMQQELGLPVAI